LRRVSVAVSAPGCALPRRRPVELYAIGATSSTAAGAERASTACGVFTDRRTTLLQGAVMRLLGLVLIMSLAGTGVAAARCADDADARDLRARVAHDLKIQPSPQAQAAAKELRRLDTDGDEMDEVDCNNVLARAKRALSAPPPEQKAQR
jgi:hypothetical protein